MPFRTVPIRRAGLLAVAALAAAPLVAAAAPHQAGATGARSDVTISLGTVYGGLTAQDWPVIVEVDSARRRIARIAAGVELQCNSGVIRVSDGWEGLRVKRGRFGASFGPDAEPGDDGTTMTTEGAVSGRFNRSKSKVSGTWSGKATLRDAAGVITETCDSGVVHWSAKD